MTDTSGVIGEPNFKDSIIVFNNSGTQDANNGNNTGNNQESKEEPVVWGITDGYEVTIWGAPQSPEEMKCDEVVWRDEEMRRAAKMSKEEQNDVITPQEKEFEGPLFNEQGELTDEVRSLLTEPDSTRWSEMSLYYDTKGGEGWFVEGLIAPQPYPLGQLKSQTRNPYLRKPTNNVKMTIKENAKPKHQATQAHPVPRRRGEG
jgi:hypothetical protein